MKRFFEPSPDLKDINLVFTNRPRSTPTQSSASSPEPQPTLMPILYPDFESCDIQACIDAFGRLANGPEQAGSIGIYANKITSIKITAPARTDYMTRASLAHNLARCIEQGYLPSLKVIHWPFSFFRADWLSPYPSGEYDEPLWKALLKQPDL